MQSPPPPTIRQAEEAQRARYAAEHSILSLFVSAGLGEGAGDDDLSMLQGFKVAAILSALSSAIAGISFQHPQDRSRSLLRSPLDHEALGYRALEEAQRAFNALLGADLDNKQRAVLWATWAYSRAADEIAEAINSGKVAHEFTGTGFSLKKVWISRSDAKVRPLHTKLHGRTVSTDKDFWRWPDTGQRLRWPGDKEAPLDATIGCRCVCLLSWANQDAVSETIQRITESTAPRD